jgi:DNA-damage-inducible protein J
MAKTSTNISIDTDIKSQAQELFADFGLDLSTAINMFLRQAVRENAIPFNITREVPNSDTIAAINEYEEFKKNPGKYKRYSSFSELLDEVRTDA